MTLKQVYIVNASRLDNEDVIRRNLMNEAGGLMSLSPDVMSGNRGNRVGESCLLLNFEV